MLDIISYSVMFCAFVFIVYVEAFYRKQFKKVRKYPFYKLRDKISLELITKKNNDETYELYKNVNRVICHLRRIRFSEYARAVSHAFNKLFEMLHRGDDPAQIKINPLEFEFAELTIKAGRDNNIFIRLATSRFGWKIFMFKGLITLFKNHPEILKKHIEELETMREISKLNNEFLHPAVV